MEILENVDLTPYNTFGVRAQAKFFCVLESTSDIPRLFTHKEFIQNKRQFLGGGSNVLFVQDFPGLVILNKLTGIEILKEEREDVFIRTLSGTNWHEFVLFAVDHNWWGVENLSLIPGTVGGAPMQNIGAYGVEVKESVYEVEAYNISTGEKKIFPNSECQFGYRDSIFKQELKEKYFISAVVFKLSKIPRINTSYRILADYLDKNNINIKTPKDISDVVIAIRESKLPNPKIIGNAGSFFKNVYVEKEKLTELLKTFPDMPFFDEDQKIKIPTGWLVEQCGPEDGVSWKGSRVGNVGVHDKQALVLVNHGGGTGMELYDLAQLIISSVYTKFGLNIAPEVNIV